MPAKPKRPGDRRIGERRKSSFKIGGLEGKPIYRRQSEGGRLTSNTRARQRRTGLAERRVGPEDRRKRQVGITRGHAVLIKSEDFEKLEKKPKGVSWISEALPDDVRLRKELGIPPKGRWAYFISSRRKARRHTDK